MAGVARLSTMRNINVLVDKTGVLEAMKEELTEYPERLRKAVLNASYPYIWDEENVGRAVLRKDIVFNHHVFQHSLDLFLQTLYALNNECPGAGPARRRSCPRPRLCSGPEPAGDGGPPAD